METAPFLATPRARLYRFPSIVCGPQANATEALGCKPKRWYAIAAAVALDIPTSIKTHSYRLLTFQIFVELVAFIPLVTYIPTWQVFLVDMTHRGYDDVDAEDVRLTGLDSVQSE